MDSLEEDIFREDIWKKSTHQTSTVYENTTIDESAADLLEADPATLVVEEFQTSKRSLGLGVETLLDRVQFDEVPGDVSSQASPNESFQTFENEVTDIGTLQEETHSDPGTLVLEDFHEVNSRSVVEAGHMDIVEAGDVVSFTLSLCDKVADVRERVGNTVDEADGGGDFKVGGICKAPADEESDDVPGELRKIITQTTR
jgi:hypothetical protein